MVEETTYYIQIHIDPKYLRIVITIINYVTTFSSKYLLNEVKNPKIKD